MMTEVIDITFKGGRDQSEILNELNEDGIEVTKNHVEIPVSLTHEQLINFCDESSKNSHNQNEKRVYDRLVSLIRENLELKILLRSYQNKELREKALDQETPMDLQQEEHE